MIDLVYIPIDTAAVLAKAASTQTGATVLFLGTTREFTNGKQTTRLEYECYPEMARRELEKLEAEARAKWSIVECVIVHRLGLVPLGEASVAIAVSTPHRRDAFEAGQWLIDRLKEVVPIWKQENWADGSSEWVHPGMAPPGEQVVSP